MKAKTFAKLLGAATILAATSSAQAYLLPFSGGNFQLSDNSAENLIKDGGNTGTILEIGDVLHGIFFIQDISGNSISSGSGYDELSGVFEAKVLSASGGPGNYTWTFGANAGSAFTTTYGAGAMVAYFTDPTHEYTRETSTGQTAAQLEALVTDGSLLWVAGFAAGADNFWRSRADTNDTSAPGIPANTAFGQYQWGLDLLTNNSGLQFNQVPCFNASTGLVTQVDQCGNGQVLTPAPASGFTTPYAVWDDQNVAMNRSIPEPASLALLGLGLVGLGFSRKAKKNA